MTTTARKTGKRSSQPAASDAIPFPRKPWDHDRECLTASGKRFLERWFATCGSGVGLLRLKYAWVYNRATGAGMTLPEIESVCYESAVKCVRLFEPSKGRFSTYYGNSMWRNLWGEVQKIYERNTHGDKGRGDDNVNIEGEPYSYLSLLSEDDARKHLGKPSDQEASAIRESTEYVHEILSRANLTERERSILDLRFGLHGSTTNALRAVGDLYGISKERVRQIQASVLRKIRQDAWQHEKP